MVIGIIGAGRIGKVHAKNISAFVPEMKIKTIADPFMTDETRKLAKVWGANGVSDAREILDDREIEAVLICSSTDTHAKYIIQCAQAGKHIFCEKPIDYDLDRVREALDAVKKAGVKLQTGFVRRFDHNHRGVYDIVHEGRVGQVHMIKISSRDPEPPPIEYVKVSGGIFYDMMIHDFDMARFLAGSEVKQVYAQGAVMIDPEIGKAGDIDTAIVTLEFENGVIASIDNSRQAVYGYDQRVEVFGSEGCAINQNDIPSTATLWNAKGAYGGTAIKMMWDRYTGAFVSEMQAFAKAVVNDEEPQVTGLDGYYPVLIAAAATKSLKEGRPVKISEVE